MNERKRNELEWMLVQSKKPTVGNIKNLRKFMKDLIKENNKLYTTLLFVSVAVVLCYDVVWSSVNSHEKNIILQEYWKWKNTGTTIKMKVGG